MSISSNPARQAEWSSLLFGTSNQQLYAGQISILLQGNSVKVNGNCEHFL